jgi:hypothetical protein
MSECGQPPRGSGRPGDFHLLDGSWTLRDRRVRTRRIGRDDWQRSGGEPAGA